MLLLVGLWIFLLSSRLLHDQLHSLHPQSHLGVHLYFDGVQVVVDVLPEPNHLTQRTLKSFLQSLLTNLNTDASIRGLCLHGSGELLCNLWRELLIKVRNAWCIGHATSVLHFEKEDTGECLVLLRAEVDLEDNTHIVVGAEYPEALVLSVVDLARFEVSIRLIQYALHCLTDWRTHEVPLELRELVGDHLGLLFTCLSDIFILKADLFGLLLCHCFLDLCECNMG